MQKGCLIGFLVLAGIIVLACGGLYLLAARAKPLAPIGEQLASLAEGERAALESICAAAGLTLESLRPIGGWQGDIFRHELNKSAVAIEGGHVRGLGLTGVTFKTTPVELAKLPELTVLFLENGSIPDWPDLSGLHNLDELVLNGQPLSSPPPGKLPQNLRRFSMARARITDLAGLAGATGLREVDLSDNPGITSFDSLTGLQIDSLDLSRTKLASLPAALPAKGNWQINIDGTPVVNPHGLSWKGPGSYSFGGTGLGSTTQQGIVGSSRVEASGTASEVPALRPVSLPTNRGGSESIGPVVVEATIDTGKARLWLVAGSEAWFSGPWFDRGNVKGFGFLRKSGWAFKDFGAGETGRVRGHLQLTGPLEHNDFQFYIEPIDGTRVTGLKYRVSATK